ncbi:MAG: CHAT domain-containing protein, partial [Chloroflexota bacterium]
TLATTALDSLPPLRRLRADPFVHGPLLFDALGGMALVRALEADGQGQAPPLLLLDADARADAVAWEFAALPDHQLFAVRYGLLRLVDRVAPPAPSGDVINFVALAADPLVDEWGQTREGYRLDVEDELRAVRRVLEQSGVALTAQRVPPTADALLRALRRGPAVLHLTCHGNVSLGDDGPRAMLYLEDDNGQGKWFNGRELVNYPPRGVLRLVLLSACHTAEGDADLARALVANGVPFAIGMQDAFPDPLSKDLALALYEMLLLGQPLGEALRQARVALQQAHEKLPSSYPNAVGVPRGYTARDGWNALPHTAGQPRVGGLGLPGEAQLTSEVQPPRPLLGRNAELHALARLYSQGHKVVTVTGTGGMGKTALAATFAERFAWRWPRGVRAISFASDVNARTFRLALLQHLLGEATARQLADASDAEQATEILRAARDWDGLWLLDNYESVLQALTDDGGRTTDESHPSPVPRPPSGDAQSIHRLVAQLADGGATLLLTSRENPAGLSGEVVFPSPNQSLAGLALAAAADLFIANSTKAKDLRGRQDPAGLKLARDIATATHGHPLAIKLLAGEYDESAVAPADFLAHWTDELAAARRPGLAAHHLTFATAFARTYDHLPPDQQARLRALSVFPFPFYA